MCVTCGCGDDGGVRVEGEHHHDHDHDHATETLVLEERVLARNDHLAGHVRAWLDVRDIVAVNLMSSPGAGKTSLLERTVAAYAGRAGTTEVCVVEGDQETTVDADRIRGAGARAVQVNTGTACHLDATMVQRALHALEPAPGGLVFVENVGNLVCPALFDIGEHAKAVVISTTEGDDKPLKYPHMFAVADVVVVNKTDLAPYVDCDLDRLRAHVHRVNPDVVVLPVSVRTGEALDTWFAWLDGLRTPTREGAGRV